MEKNNNAFFLSRLGSIGQLPTLLHTIIDKNIKIQRNYKANNQEESVKPFFMTSRNGILAVIDNREHLWIMGNKFTSPINISQVLKIKAKKVYLGEQQFIFQNKKNAWILVSWTSKLDIQESKLRKIYTQSPIMTTYNIEAFYIQVNWNKGSFWYYSSIKKLDNIIKLYHIDSQACTITGFPIMKKIELQDSISGISLGKYHGLVWTGSGKIFSWGCKNLALGLKYYNKNYYDAAEEILMPQKVQMAHAGISYSIALGVSGNLYEWGIKNSGEPILSPTKMCIPKLKFLSIKGYNNMISGLTSNNELYIWGKRSQQVCKDIPHVTFDNQKFYIMEKGKNMKIEAYIIQQNYIIALLNIENGKLNQEENKYFHELLKRTTKKWFPNRCNKPKQTEIIQISCENIEPQLKSQKSVEILRKNEDYIDRLISHKINKENYFHSLKNEEDIFKEIMNDSQPRYYRYDYDQGEKHFKSDSNSIFRSLDEHTSSQKIATESARQTPNMLMSIQASHQFINKKQAQRNFDRKNSNRRIKTSTVKRSNLNYQLRLKKVLMKKYEIDEQKRQQRIKTIQKKALVLLRQKKNDEQIQFQTAKKQIQCLNTFFIKQFLCEMLVYPLDLGRELKIKAFMTNLSFNRISNKMKNVLYKSRAINLLKNLKENHPQKFQSLKRIFLKTFQRRRIKKARNSRQLIISELIKRCNLVKMNEKLNKLWFFTRKIQKMAKWINLQQKQHISQLRFLWKKSIILLLKPTPSFQNKKSSLRQDCNIKCSSQKIKNERLLNHLRGSPLIKFQLNTKKLLKQLQINHKQAKSYAFSYFQSINSKALTLKRNICWNESIIKQKQRDINIVENGNMIVSRKSMHSSNNNFDLLIYSQHHDYFFKPKNYQINIPDNMKISEKWVIEEKKILISLLKGILQSWYKKYFQMHLKYQYQLGQFIRDNYQMLTQYRWRFIIQYNSIKNQKIKKNSISIIKKTRDLLRVLALVNSQFLFINDVLPQKYMILDYAKKHKNSPTPPSLEIKLTQEEFKRQFKNYCESVSLKAKQVKKIKSHNN